MKITGLQAKDFLVIQELDVQPSGKLSIFAGKNRAGKSSILKAIKALFKGSTDTSLIRHGAEKAEIIADIDGIMKVRRTIRRSGSQSLDITRNDGLKPAKPQTYLDGLIGDFTFDPVAFLLDEDKRKQYLMDLCAIKVTSEDLKGIVDDETIALLDFKKDFLSVLKDAENLYAMKRRDINRSVATAKTLYEDAVRSVNGFDPNAKPERELPVIESDIKTADREIAEVELLSRQAEAAHEKIEEAKAYIETAESEIANAPTGLIERIPQIRNQLRDIAEQIERLQSKQESVGKELDRAILEDERIERLRNEIAQRKDMLNAIEVPVPAIEPIQERLQKLHKEAEAAKMHEKHLAEYEAAQKHKAEYDKLKSESDSLTSIIEKLRVDIPETLARKSNVPVPGLRFDGDRIFVGEKSIDNMSTSEQIDFAISVVEQMNKDYQLKVMCLDRAESLDDETLKEFAGKVPEDWQFFLTYVQRGDTAPDGAFIVDHGSVKQEALSL